MLWKTFLMGFFIIDTINKEPSENKWLMFVRNHKTIAFASLGIILSLLSLISYFVYPLVIKMLIQSVLNLKPDGEFYAWWSHPLSERGSPTEVSLKFFHIENPYEVENGGKVLRVKERGNFMFKQYSEKQIVGFSDDLTTVTYFDKMTYHYDYESSTGNLDEEMTFINAPLAAIGAAVPKLITDMPLGPFMRLLAYHMVNSFLESHQEHLFINVTARDLIFGYKLELLESAVNLAKRLERVGIYMDILPTQAFPNHIFGIFNGRNGTLSGPFEMYTGLTGTKNKFGYFKSWNNQSKLTWWKNDQCNAIKGTDGTIWPPGISKSDRLYFYVPDVCRSIYMTYLNESTFKGINTWIFTAPESVLAGKDKNPENECFCMDSNDSRCRLNGVFDLSPCQANIPIIISLPHFLNVDVNITSRIEGLKPDPDLHRPIVHVEPTMGTVLHGDSRLQMSIRIEKNIKIRGFEHLDGDFYVPLFWGYKKLGLTDDFAEVIKSRLFKPIKVISTTIIIIFIIGLFTFLVSFCYQVLSCKKQKNISRISYYPYDEMKLPPLSKMNMQSTTNSFCSPMKKASIRSHTSSIYGHYEWETLMNQENVLAKETIV